MYSFCKYVSCSLHGTYRLMTDQIGFANVRTILNDIPGVWLSLL